MNHTIYIHSQVTPKTIQIDVPDEPRWIEAVYEETEATGEYGEPGVDGEPISTLVTPGHWAEPSTHKEDVLNIPPAPVYPATFGKLIWFAREVDRYSDNPNHRAELWEDTEGTATYAQIIATFPNLPRYVEIAARNWGSERLRELVSPYGDSERETWHVQQREAEAYMLDSAAPVPMIAAMAAARSIPVGLMAGKIIENVDLFRQLSGVILGKQQALIDQGYNAASLADLLAVSDSIGINLLSI